MKLSIITLLFSGIFFISSCNSNSPTHKEVNIDSLADLSQVPTRGMSTFATQEEAEQKIKELTAKLETATDEEKEAILAEINDAKVQIANFVKVPITNQPPKSTLTLVQQDSLRAIKEKKEQELKALAEKEKLKKTEELSVAKKSLSDDVKNGEEKISDNTAIQPVNVPAVKPSSVPITTPAPAPTEVPSKVTSDPTTPVNKTESGKKSL